MELKNYENMIGEFENKITLINQELMRLTQVLKDKEDEINGYKQREFKLNQQLKEQQQWEYENKQLRTNLDNRVK
jgi:chromosome segregation ATPase